MIIKYSVSRLSKSCFQKNPACSCDKDNIRPYMIDNAQKEQIPLLLTHHETAKPQNQVRTLSCGMHVLWNARAVPELVEILGEIVSSDGFCLPNMYLLTVTALNSRFIADAMNLDALRSQRSFNHTVHTFHLSNVVVVLDTYLDCELPFDAPLLYPRFADDPGVPEGRWLDLVFEELQTKSLDNRRVRGNRSKK